MRNPIVILSAFYMYIKTEFEGLSSSQNYTPTSTENLSSNWSCLYALNMQYQTVNGQFEQWLLIMWNINVSNAKSIDKFLHSWCATIREFTIRVTGVTIKVGCYNVMCFVFRLMQTQ